MTMNEITKGPRSIRAIEFKSHKGFTLLEVMIAIGIFSVIALASWQMLKGTTEANRRLARADAEIFSIQKTFTIISSDLRQLVARPILDELGDQQPALTSNLTDELLSFTRMSGAYIPGNEKLLLERISYVLEESDDEDAEFDSNDDSEDQLSLYRYIWPVIDRIEEVEPRKQLLLKNLGHMEFQFYDKEGEIYSEWPEKSEDQPGTNTDTVEIDLEKLSELPVGINIKIESEAFGVIERLIARSQVILTSES